MTFLTCLGQDTNLGISPTGAPYSPPIELYSRGSGKKYLIANETRVIECQVYPEEALARFSISYRSNPGDRWIHTSEAEGTNQYLTAAAAVAPDKLYVAGTNKYGATRIRKWQIRVTDHGQISVSRTSVTSGRKLTHIRAMAVSPNEDFLIAQNHETGTVYRMDLESFERQDLITSSMNPDIVHYDNIVYRKHVDHGHAFLMTAGWRSGRMNPDTVELPKIILWDNDLDGSIELQELVDNQGFVTLDRWSDEKWQPTKDFMPWIQSLYAVPDDSSTHPPRSQNKHEEPASIQKD